MRDKRGEPDLKGCQGFVIAAILGAVILAAIIGGIYVLLKGI